MVSCPWSGVCTVRGHQKTMSAPPRFVQQSWLARPHKGAGLRGTMNWTPGACLEWRRESLVMNRSTPAAHQSRYQANNPLQGCGRSPLSGVVLDPWRAVVGVSVTEKAAPASARCTSVAKRFVGSASLRG